MVLLNSDKKTEKGPDKIANKISPLWQRIIISLFMLFSVFGVMSFGFLPDTLEVGQVSPETFYAPREVEDRYTTSERKDQAAQEVPEVYDLDTGVKDRTVEQLNQAFFALHDYHFKLDDELADIDNNGLEDLDEERAAIREELIADYREEITIDLDEDVVIPIGMVSEESIENMQEETEQILIDFMEQGIKPERLEGIREQLQQRVDVLPYSPELTEFSHNVLLETLVPNMNYNAEATEERRQEAREQVDPVIIMEGEVIVREGERLTDRHLMILEDLGLQRAHGDYFMLVGLFFLIGVFLVLIGMYLYLYRERVFYNNTLLVLLGLIFVATLILGRVLSAFSGYLIPTAMAAILITVLFGARVSLLIVSVLSLLMGVMANSDINITILSLISGFVGTYSVAKLQQRGDLTRSGFYIAGANAVVIVALSLVEGGFQLDTDLVMDISTRVVYGVLNGFISTILAIGFLPFLESAFGLTTSVKLLELANPNQPLMKRLLLEAPGTYHHSMIVANLAETAADEVGANTILARVGAYYHDIGKVNRPYFFIENQLTKDNPHDKISPSLSSLIITSHTKDGVELAQKYKLPQDIVDIIKEHHGTKQCSYFYQKAVEANDKVEQVQEEDFQYSGPKPQTKESAIILLADSVEAAVRTISMPNKARIQSLVRKLIKQYLADGQLDECPLTLADLNTISDSFVQVLSGIFHSRIEYPENLPKRSNDHGTRSNKSESDESERGTERHDESNHE